MQIRRARGRAQEAGAAPCSSQESPATRGPDPGGPGVRHFPLGRSDGEWSKSAQETLHLPMGRLRCGCLFPMSCLFLLWVAGTGGVEVLREPTCFSDFLSTSTCEWEMDSPTNCSSELRLSYQLDYDLSPENFTCVPENSEDAMCMCTLFITEDVTSADSYKLALWAGRRLLWTGLFIPSEHVKPRAPANLTVHGDISNTWLLTWSNPYPLENFLYTELIYLVNVSNENDPADFKIYNVTYLVPTLRLPASTLKSGVTYSARVRAWSQSYNSTWSEWSPSAKWLNNYDLPFEKRLPLSVSISCVAIPAICLFFYYSFVRIKKEWWDQIPNPAHSPLVAIVIQDSQMSLWERRSRGQEPAKCPHWKTCLTKLLPCLLEHGVKRDEDAPKAPRNRPFQGPGKPAWRPVEVSKTVLWPESISVVQSVELFEAPVESEEEEAEDEGSFCTSLEGSGSSFQDGREGIVARLTESLFLDLLGDKDNDPGQQGLGELCLIPPSGSAHAQMPWAEFPRAGPKQAFSQGEEQPFDLEPDPPASLPQGPTGLTGTEMPVVIADNPAYRSFSSSLSQSPSPGELGPDLQLAAHLEEVDPEIPCVPQPSEATSMVQPEPETWEQILRQSVLQHRGASAPASAPASGYREFTHAVEQGSTPYGAGAGCSPPGDAGYKAFSSLLASSAGAPGTPGCGVSSGEGGYKPFQNLPGCPGDAVSVSVPLFSFGLDLEPPQSPQNSLLPSSSPDHLGPEPMGKGDSRQKPLLSPEQATDALRDDLGSGIVYSALTCHLCGHLKQCHGQEEGGQVHVASPCCGCRCGDRSSPPESPLRALVLSGGGTPLASLAPLDLSEGKSSLSFQPAPGNTQGSIQTPKMGDLVSTGPSCTRAS
ncbi:interleukin-4 receptor subunit alpha isoform X2 [Tupaia chinensis]|uniref:interleukin-4 receptor subunit alpha isoform X2 n=1 Tax=Tupaia chinensis TaxID=246437 RepID=UPI0003C90604|nr:interleukin-4 receptor subunit alpha isoform X2 [Tupaia chinensis]